MPLGFFSTALHDVLVQVQVLAVFGELSHNVIHAGLLLVPGNSMWGASYLSSTSTVKSTSSIIFTLLKAHELQILQL